MPLRVWLIACFLIFLGGCSSSSWAPSGVYHTVERGETLYAISRTYGVDMRHLARINGVEDPSRLRVGQQLLIPGAEREREIPRGSPAGTASPAIGAPAPKTNAGTPAGTAGAGSAQQRQTPPSGMAEAKKRSPGSPAGASKKGFVWPVRGQILQSFGRHGDRFCQGLEIAAPAGTPVVSAAAGRVTYSGNGIRGYGHLVIIRHEDDFFTVYGFNQKSLVETGTQVHQGQQIALSGIPPGGGPPRLHFEIRRGKSPVDPIFYLP